MKLNKGLFRDVSLAEQPNGTWIGGKNLVFNNKYNELITELGFTQLTNLTNTNLFPIGVISTPDTIIVCSVHTGGTYNSEIGKIENNIYTVILRADINFSVSYPVIGTYYYNYKQELIIVWSDRNEGLKICNVDDLPFNVDINKQIIDNTELFKININSSYSTPTYNIKSIIESGGSLPSGVYQVTIQYELIDNSYGDCLNISNPIIIHNSASTQGFYAITGCEPGTPTSKAIDIKIENLDSRYTRFRFAIIYKANDVVQCYVSEPKTVNDIARYIISTTTGLESTTLTEILVKNADYSKVGALTNIKNTLWIGDLEVAEELRYQKYASNIKVGWVYTKQASLNGFRGSYKDPTFIYLNKSFMPGEVVALYIRFRYKNSVKTTQAFHIPGRVATGSDLDKANSEALSIYQYAKYFHMNEYVNSDGQMAYWENTNEEYPNNTEFDGSTDYTGSTLFINGQPGEDLRGKKVRHHKLPSVRKLIERGKLPIENLATTVNPTFSLDKLSAQSPVNYRKEFIFSYMNGDGGFFSNFNKTFTNISSGTILINVNIQLSFNVGFYNNGSPSTGSVVVLLMNDGAIVHNHTTVGGISVLISESIVYTISLDPGDTIELSIIATSSVQDSYSEITYNIPKTSNEGSIVTSGMSESFYDGTLGGKVLGLYLTQIIIPDNIRALCDGYEILYAERNNDNCTVLSQGMLSPRLKLSTTSLDSTALVYDRFYDYDLLSTKKAFKASYIKPEAYLPHQLFRNANEILTEYHAGSSDLNIIKVTENSYVDKCSSYSTPENNWREEHIHLTFDGTKLYPITPVNTVNAQLEDTGYLYYYAAKNTILATLYTFKEDLYIDFSNQKLVSTGVVNLIVPAENIATVYGGDVHVNNLGIKRTTYIALPTDYDDLFYQSFRHAYNLFPCYSISNIGLRYEGKDLIDTFFPAFNLIDNKKGAGNTHLGQVLMATTPAAISTTRLQSILLANNIVMLAEIPEYYPNVKDYNSINNIEPISCFNINDNFITVFTKRVHKSNAQGSESKFQNWRKFNPVDYYEIQSDKGKINVLSNDGRDLLIFCEHSMFVVKNIQQLDISSDVVSSLGNAQLFNTDPIEVSNDKDGLIGCASRFGVLRIDIGIVIVDRYAGKIYIYNDGKIYDISVGGLELWFKSFLQYSSVFSGTMGVDNPYQNSGIHISWDKEYSRILFTKHKHNSNSVTSNETSSIDNYTLSYYPEIKQWAFFHDYIPAMSVNNRKGLFHITNYGFYKANSNQIRNQYFSTPKDCYIDIVFNMPQHKDKLYESVSWITNYIKNGITLKTKSFDSIRLFTNNLHSGIINLDSTNVRNIGNVNRFNDIRDVVEEANKNVNFINMNLVNALNESGLVTTKYWYNKGKFINPYVVVRLTLNAIPMEESAYPVVDFRIFDVDVNDTLIPR
jgi:hypothetical protein